MIKKVLFILGVAAVIGYGSFSVASASVTNSVNNHQHQLAKTVDSF